MNGRLTAASHDPAAGVTGGVPMLTALTFAGMAAGTFTITSLGVLASFIIDDLGITRGQLGLIIGADTLFAALFSPIAGRAADRLGGRRALIALFVLAAMAWVAYGVAPVFGLMFVGALLGGLADASCNPATNRMIVVRLPPGRRGAVTGMKQSGVQAGVFFAGVALPTMAVAMGWRTAFAIVAVIPLLFAVATARLVAPASRRPRHERSSPGRLPVSIRWLAGFGFLFGVAGAAAVLVPLYVEESLGLDARVGGLVAATAGLVAVGARVWWAHLAERTGRVVETLWAMTPIGIVGAMLFLLAGSAGSWLIWPAAVSFGLSTAAWNGVGMLAAMNDAGAAATGRASGIIISGFLLGQGIAPPIYGALVDATGSYAPMWWLAAAAAFATALLVGAWELQRRRERAVRATP
ncbi:MAG TPA: MFS transporter [Acidimicrobiia bacterium]|nr:MFS transporter [Acidimicrobiia bacterium]